MVATGETEGLAKWIINDTCLVVLIVAIFKNDKKLFQRSVSLNPR